MSSRVEELVSALLSGGTVSFEPHSRMESYLLRCINGGGTEGLPNPISRVDILLYQLAEKIPSLGSGSGSGSEVPAEDVASDEEVNTMIDDIFGTDYTEPVVPAEAVATDEEVSSVIDEIFSPEPDAVEVV